MAQPRLADDRRLWPRTGGARLELGLNAERTISRRRENAEKAAKASAAK
jgi:hypothetical protein